MEKNDKLLCDNLQLPNRNQWVLESYCLPTNLSIIVTFSSLSLPALCRTRGQRVIFCEILFAIEGSDKWCKSEGTCSYTTITQCLYWEVNSWAMVYPFLRPESSFVTCFGNSSITILQSELRWIVPLWMTAIQRVFAESIFAHHFDILMNPRLRFSSGFALACRLLASLFTANNN